MNKTIFEAAIRMSWKQCSCYSTNALRAEHFGSPAAAAGNWKEARIAAYHARRSTAFLKEFNDWKAGNVS